jgi:hypothetical protein
VTMSPKCSVCLNFFFSLQYTQQSLGQSWENTTLGKLLPPLQPLLIPLEGVSQSELSAS